MRFALKTREPIVLSGDRWRQDLDAALADLGDDFVDAETGAGSEGQVVGLYGRSLPTPLGSFRPQICGLSRISFTRDPPCYEARRIGSVPAGDETAALAPVIRRSFAMAVTPGVSWFWLIDWFLA